MRTYMTKHDIMEYQASYDYPTIIITFMEEINTFLDNKNISVANSRKFTLEDRNLNTETDLVYYRLKQMDNSGKHNYSYIIYTDLNKISSANIQHSKNLYNDEITSTD